MRAGLWERDGGGVFRGSILRHIVFVLQWAFIIII